MVRELAVGMPVIQESKGILESFLVRLAVASWPPQAPLSNHRCPVTGVAECHCNRDVFRPQRDFSVPSNPGMPGVKTGHESRSGGRADGAASVILRKADAFPRQAVQHRGLEPG